MKLFGLELKKIGGGHNFTEESRLKGAEKSNEVQAMKKKLKNMQVMEETLVLQEELHERIENIKMMRKERELDMKEREADISGSGDLSFEDQIFMKTFDKIFDNKDKFNKNDNSGFNGATTQAPPIETTPTNVSQEDTEKQRFGDDFLARLDEMPVEKYDKFVKLMERML